MIGAEPPILLRVGLVQQPDELRDALQRCLEAAGLQVEVRDPDAVTEFSISPPDVLLLSDIAAPQALLAALRLLPGLWLVPIVLLARDAHADVRWPAIAAGADDVLAEDVPMAELVAALQARVRRAQIAAAVSTAAVEVGVPAGVQAGVDAGMLAGVQAGVEAGVLGGRDEGIVRRTGALRRGEFLAQLHQALREQAPWQVLVAVRLDQQRALAETLGQAAAFELEQAVALRLGTQLAPGDAHALWMEFGFGLLVRREDRDAVEALARRLCAAVAAAPFEVRGKSHALTVSVGIALAPAGVDSGDVDRWFASAHAAQAIAHRLGGNRFDGVLSRDHGDMPPERVLIIREWVKDAVGGENVLIEFQPVIPLQDGQAGLYSLQAKLRDYRAPLAGVSRRDYLGLAREAGALQMIDRMSLFAAFEAIEAERAQGRNTRVLVPLDLASVNQAQLLWLDSELRRRRAHADGLLVELDAELALARADFAAVVQRLEAQGVVIAIADGSGDMDRIAQLQRLPAGLLRLPLAALDSVGAERFSELLAAWQANGREILVDRVEDVTRVHGLWRLQATYAQGDALAASSPRLDYEFTPFGS